VFKDWEQYPKYKKTKAYKWQEEIKNSCSTTHRRHPTINFITFSSYGDKVLLIFFFTLANSFISFNHIFRTILSPFNCITNFVVKSRTGSWSIRLFFCIFFYCSPHTDKITTPNLINVFFVVATLKQFYGNV